MEAAVDVLQGVILSCSGIVNSRTKTAKQTVARLTTIVQQAPAGSTGRSSCVPLKETTEQFKQTLVMPQKPAHSLHGLLVHLQVASVIVMIAIIA